MQRKLIRLSRRYQAALGNHLRQGPRGGLQPASRLGRQAVAIGLETLDVARIHEGALVTLEAPSRCAGALKRGESCSTNAITPMENTHHSALKPNARSGHV